MIKRLFFLILEENGVQVEKNDGSTFLSNMAMKVTDVTNDKKDEMSEKVSNLIDDNQEVKQVYEVKILEDDIEVKADGTLVIRIPIDDPVENPVDEPDDHNQETVQKVYNPSNIGGASTGDTTNIQTYFGLTCVVFVSMLLIVLKRKHEDEV